MSADRSWDVAREGVAVLTALTNHRDDEACDLIGASDHPLELAAFLGGLLSGLLQRTNVDIDDWLGSIGLYAASEGR